MSWGAVAALCGAAYALKILGAIGASRTPKTAATGAPLELLVVPVIAGLIVVQTLGQNSDLVLDARLPALMVAAVLIWRKAPLLVVVVAAGGTAALLHHAWL